MEKSSKRCDGERIRCPQAGAWKDEVQLGKGGGLETMKMTQQEMQLLLVWFCKTSIALKIKEVSERQP